MHQEMHLTGSHNYNCYKLFFYFNELKKVKTTLVGFLHWHGKRIRHVCFKHIKEVRISTTTNMSYST